MSEARLGQFEIVGLRALKAVEPVSPQAKDSPEDDAQNPQGHRHHGGDAFDDDDRPLVRGQLERGGTGWASLRREENKCPGSQSKAPRDQSPLRDRPARSQTR